MNINQLHKIKWEDSIWFSDVDDTLITTADSSIPASIGIKDVFTARFGSSTGEQVQKEFISIFSTMLSVHRGRESTQEYHALLREIENYQKDYPPEYGKPKKWSREIFLAIAAKRLSVPVSTELLSEAIDAYWMQLTQIADIIPGVHELVAEITKHKRPLYLVTGSDARLTLDKDGNFTYDPAFSEAFKRERVAYLRQRGLHFNLVSIGDPEDKPHRDFFEKAVRMAESDLGKKINLSNAIIFGDSFAADLQTPKDHMGFGLVVLYQEGKKDTEIIDEHQITTGNIATITEYLD